MRRALIRSPNLLLGCLLIVLSVVVGGILGVGCGLWAAILFDAIVIGVVLFWYYQRNTARGRRAADGEER